MTSVKYEGNSQWAYGYDYEDRLVSAKKVGGTDSYSYTSEGGRYYITDSLGSRLQCNDGEDPTAPLLYDGLNFFDAGIGQTVGSSGTDVSYVSDSLGSTLGDIDSTHTVKQNDVYDAFGNIVYAGSLFSYPNGESVLFGGAQGYHTDNDTGLIRCGNRYYNPYIGRFITQDPIGDGDNWYAYCDNDPVDGSDKTGETPTAPNDFVANAEDEIYSNFNDINEELQDSLLSNQEIYEIAEMNSMMKSENNLLVSAFGVFGASILFGALGVDAASDYSGFLVSYRQFVSQAH